MKYFEIMRPSHWTKNVFVFAAVIFGKKLFAPADEMLLAFGSALGAFFCFCLASSAIYIFNDIIDRETDRLHPEKKIQADRRGYGSCCSCCCSVGYMCRNRNCLQFHARPVSGNYYPGLYCTDDFIFALLQKNDDS